MPDRLQSGSKFDLPTEDHTCYHEQPDVKSFQSPYPPEERANLMPAPHIELVQSGQSLTICDNEPTDEFPPSQPCTTNLEVMPSTLKVFASKYGGKFIICTQHVASEQIDTSNTYPVFSPACLKHRGTTLSSSF